MVWSLLAAAVALGFLSATYRLIESEWPISYSSVSDYASYRKMTFPIGYLLFRLGPPFAVSLFGAVNLQRSGRPVVAFLLVVGGLHAWQTSARTAWQLWRGVRSDSRRGPLIAMHLVVVLFLCGAVVAAGLLADTLSELVPQWQEILPELWGAVATAVLAVALLRTTQNQSVDPAELTAVHQKKLGDNLLSYADELAISSGASPIVVRSIMIAESIQRPPWFRVLERLKGRIFGSGTYGLMQVSWERPISDVESIRIATTTYLAGVTPTRGASGCLDYESLQGVLAMHNASQPFLELATPIAYALDEEARR